MRMVSAGLLGRHLQVQTYLCLHVCVYSLPDSFIRKVWLQYRPWALVLRAHGPPGTVCLHSACVLHILITRGSRGQLSCRPVLERSPRLNLTGHSRIRTSEPASLAPEPTSARSTLHPCRMGPCATSTQGKQGSCFSH